MEHDGMLRILSPTLRPRVVPIYFHAEKWKRRLFL